MCDFFRRVPFRASAAGPDPRVRPSHFSFFRKLMICAIAGAVWLPAMTSLVGCGDSIDNPPYDPVAAKANPKYKELHPEEFPAPKAKAAKARRPR
ncbi:MAG: hypothetical protein ABS79_05635 [Planctomycetes bacterium SCN 63-9]|nr:MAG: hypothetical protein ABS79_05635 [Planctomycetes bacterium SCN 63-9]